MMRSKARNNPGMLLRAWLLLHAQSFIYSLGQYYRNLLTSILTTAVIGISLALPGGFYLLLENAHQITAGWDD
ncbi:MAG: cell division protein, partial [Gammaproteobacteria bacterium]